MVWSLDMFGFRTSSKLKPTRWFPNKRAATGAPLTS